jgi:hypothetical protein
MKRREFIVLLGSGAAAWPVMARAQQSAMPVIGVLGGGSVAAGTFRVAAIKQGLKEAGYVEGQTSRSNIAGRTINTVSCQHWRPIWPLAK